jgi:hypothetical protein
MKYFYIYAYLKTNKVIAMIRTVLLFFLLGIIGKAVCQPILRKEEKIKAMPLIAQKLSDEISRKRPRGFTNKQGILDFSKKLNNQGLFSDLLITEAQAKNKNWTNQGKVGTKLATVFSRLRDMAWGIRNGIISQCGLKDKLCKAVSNYCSLEISRPDVNRFHASCFALPTLASEIYFILYHDLHKKNASSEIVKACKMLQKVAFQAFTQPRRKNLNDPYSVNQYRKHVWWVGGNFAYRNPFLCAAACNDYRMLETAWQVCNAAISTVSFNTLQSAFWNEGMCVDGAAWGHGPQSYAFGYGIDGVNGIIRVLKKFQNTPWMKENLPDNKLKTLIDFADGMTWLQYRMRPCMTINGRHNLTAGANYGGKRISGYLHSILQMNPSQEIKNEINKIEQKYEKDDQISLYGTRCFWNNDDLVMRGKNYYVFVNMISSRSVGPESVANRHSELNYNLADGSTVLLRSGDEYDYSKGAWDYSIPPGTTNRKLKKMPSVTIWEGFRSKHNFAGGIGGTTGCSGFIFEKAEHSTRNPQLKVLYGVKAYKSYFMLDGIMVALGAGIRNLKPDLDGNIITNLNQTALRGSVVYGVGGAKENTAEIPFEKTFDMANLDHPLWCIQDGIAYIILPQYTNAPVDISAKKEKTNWTLLDKRNSQNSKLPKSIDLFELSIDHGKIPTKKLGDKYAYIVMMECISSEKVIGLIESKRIKIVANNTGIQAVWDNKLKIAQMVIFSPKATYDYNGLEVRSLSPAVIQVESLENGKRRISLADPTQNPKLKSIILIVNKRKIVVPLPQKPFCGKSTVIDI